MQRAVCRRSDRVASLHSNMQREAWVMGSDPEEIFAAVKMQITKNNYHYWGSRAKGIRLVG